MSAQFVGFGMSFLYPESWRVDEEDELQSVTLESPEGAFLSITRFANTADSQAALARALETMQQEYDEVEREQTVRSLAGLPLAGMLLRFVYLDLIIVSQLLAFEHAGHSYLVQTQAEDRDHDRLAMVFDAMLTSLGQNLLRSET